MDIRPQNDSGLQYAKPDVMYFLKEMFNVRDHGTSLDVSDVHCVPKTSLDEFRELAHLLKPNLEIPLDPESALHLFLELNELVTNADRY
ncbi:MAG: hypothetical protein AB2693_33285 [Candidatus Thiodiazotropha sp.]